MSETEYHVLRHAPPEPDRIYSPRIGLRVHSSAAAIDDVVKRMIEVGWIVELDRRIISRTPAGQRALDDEERYRAALRGTP